jgi:[FeFe] hydrogenase H-cluster maturation GTPase HydF
LAHFNEKGLPYIIAYTKADLVCNHNTANKNEIYVSSVTGDGINSLKNMLGLFAKDLENEKCIISDLLKPNDVVVLVTPIDESAPKGRLILPQQQTIRDIINAHCTAIVCQPEELKATIAMLKTKPSMVVTDSQAFESVEKNTPSDIRLTSFSILFAKYKGNLQVLVDGAKAIDTLKNGDKILVAEGCTHHRQCNDIGTVKLPRLIEKHTGVKPQYKFVSGGEFPDELGDYKLIIHCGGCMLNEKEMQSRINKATSQNVPIVNYGVAIAHIHSILPRALSPFGNISY